MDVTIYNELIGKTPVSVVHHESVPERLNGLKLSPSQHGGEGIVFEMSDGTAYAFTHFQECCEDVYVDDICGDLDDLVGSPLLMAEETSGTKSWGTWTFYKFATIKGYVDVKFHGESNGHYSESVYLVKYK